MNDFIRGKKEGVFRLSKSFTESNGEVFENETKRRNPPKQTTSEISGLTNLEKHYKRKRLRQL